MKYFLLLSLLTPIAQADTLIRAFDADPLAYRAQLEAEVADQSWSEWWIRHRVDPSSERELARRLTEAQSEFLQGGLLEAERKFQSVLDLASSEDWRSREREAFAYAALRLAQMSQDQERQEAWLRQAARWSGVNLDAKLFPPPLWTKYLKFGETRLKENMDVDLWFPEARYLLVDGQPYQIQAGTKWTTDSFRHRFTLVYDHAKPVSREGTWTEFKMWRPVLAALVNGNCEEPDTAKLSKAKTKIFYREGCVRGQSETLKDRPPLTPFRNSVELTWPVSPPPSRPFIERPGLWLAGGLVATALVVALAQKKESNKSPTTTVGF